MVFLRRFVLETPSPGIKLRYHGLRSTCGHQTRDMESGISYSRYRIFFGRPLLLDDLSQYQDTLSFQQHLNTMPSDSLMPLVSAMSLLETAHAQTQQPAMQNGSTKLIEAHRAQCYSTVIRKQLRHLPILKRCFS